MAYSSPPRGRGARPRCARAATPPPAAARLAASLLASVWLAAAGCDSDAGGVPCVEGSIQACFCAPDVQGFSTCTGGRRGPCECAPADAGADPRDGGRRCRTTCGAIDVLFVVDNSISMAPMQDELARNFRTFTTQLRELFPTSDVHVLVTDSDEAGYEGGLCEASCPDTRCEGYVCGSIGERDACDTVLGAGVVRPLGDRASNRRCPFPAGRRYATSYDADFEAAVQCAARVGASGDGEERPLGATLGALAESAPGGCNEGFLRDDALLVVVMITDASPGTSMEQSGSVAAFREQVLSTKCGREDAVVFLGFVHGADAVPPEGERVDVVARCAAEPTNACCELCRMEGPEGPGCLTCFAGESDTGPTCWTYFTGPSAPLESLVGLFGDRGFRASVCADDYGPLFQDAVDVIDDACQLL